MKQLNFTKYLFLTILASFIMLSCNNNKEQYKVGYINLIQVYNSIPSLMEADSTHKVQLQRINMYVNKANQHLKELNIDEKSLNEMTKAYNDTVASFKSQIDRDYTTIAADENNQIQAAIDSLAKMYNYNYILSTANSSILYVKDSTDNLTLKLIEILNK